MCPPEFSWRRATKFRAREPTVPQRCRPYLHPYWVVAPCNSAVIDCRVRSGGSSVRSRHTTLNAPGLPNAQLFFDVCAMKPPSCGRTFEPLHFGHFTSLFSRSETVMINSKGLLHFSHTNS